MLSVPLREMPEFIRPVQNVLNQCLFVLVFQGDKRVMEKLDLLAQRIDGLIQEINRLREENHHLREESTRLREDLELGQMASEDLQEQLNRERDVHNEVCSRVDELIGRIQNTLPAVEQQQNG